MYKIENKSRAKKIIDVLLVGGMFILCLITIIATDIEPDSPKETTSAGMEYVHDDNNTDKNSEEEIIAENNIEPDEKSTVVHSDESVFDSQTEQPVSAEVDQIQTEHESEEISPPEFTAPVCGGVSRNFSIDKLMYNPTMDDWRIHSGVDIYSEIGTDVISAERGTVAFAGFDDKLGYTVVIEREMYKCIYASLESDIPVSEGQTVEKGQIIGSIGNSMISEYCDNPHLHFEMKINDEYVNPQEYIEFY